jgi:hypothetical protein
MLLASKILIENSTTFDICSHALYGGIDDTKEFENIYGDATTNSSNSPTQETPSIPVVY